jgi:HK97 family phage major capsid protein
MAKFSAKLILTDEMLQDASYVASAFRMKMQSRAMLFADGEVYDGNGSDGAQPKHVYGIQGHATAFDATVVPDDAKVENGNIGDLMDAIILQAETEEQRGLNKVWINPKDFIRFKYAKDKNGQYLFIKDVNGNYSINGLRVVRTNKVTAGTLLVADSTKIQLWWKRGMEVKFGQMNGTDFEKDQYTAVLFARMQVVVEGVDQKALIYVSDITAAITAISAADAN